MHQKYETIVLKNKFKQSLTRASETPSKRTSKKTKRHRLLWLDALRGLAIVLMIIFHFCYDMRYFGWVDWNIPNGSNWWPLRYIILSLFTFTVGFSLALAHQRQFLQKVFIKRIAQLLLGAACVTIMSLFLFSNSWIYFGILHFIVVGSLISIMFIKVPIVALCLGCTVLVGFWTSIVESHWPFDMFKDLLPRNTEDLVPLFPWLGVVLIGMGLGSALPASEYDVPKNTITQLLATVGRHGLIIYLIHQPLLFSGFTLLQMLR